MRRPRPSSSGSPRARSFSAAASAPSRFGHTGPDVKVLQMKLGNLRERAHDVDEEGRKRIDGIFGPLTQQDVIDFQTDAGLDPDGVVGPKTWDALNSLVPGMVSEEQEVELDERFGAAYEARAERPVRRRA